MKTRATHIIIFIFVWINISGQTARIAEINKITNISRFIYGKDTGDIQNGNKIDFPIIITDNAIVDKKINHLVFKSLMYDSRYEKHPIKIAIDSFVIDGLINMQYYISYNKNGILSMHIQYDHCGANCWINDDFINIDLLTGKLISINDIIASDSLSKFKLIALSDKASFLRRFIDSLNYTPNKETYNAVLNKLKECKRNLPLDEFQLKDSVFVLFNKCYMATYLRPYEPEVLLRYKYIDIERFLRKDFFEKINK